MKALKAHIFELISNNKKDEPTTKPLRVELRGVAPGDQQEVQDQGGPLHLLGHQDSKPLPLHSELFFIAAFPAQKRVLHPGFHAPVAPGREGDPDPERGAPEPADPQLARVGGEKGLPRGDPAARSGRATPQRVDRQHENGSKLLLEHCRWPARKMGEHAPGQLHSPETQESSSEADAKVDHPNPPGHRDEARRT